MLVGKYNRKALVLASARSVLYAGFVVLSREQSRGQVGRKSKVYLYSEWTLLQ